MRFERKSHTVLRVAGIALVLIAVYFGVFYWLFEPETIQESSGRLVTALVYRHDRGADFTNQVVERAARLGVFRPAAWLDRRLRPRVWNP